MFDTINYFEDYLRANYPLTKANGHTLTKADLVEILYDRLGVSRAESAEVVEFVFNEIEKALISGRDVKLSNFGSFSPRDKVARPGRNPKTGQAHEISARRVISFVPAPVMRDAAANFKDPE